MYLETYHEKVKNTQISQNANGDYSYGWFFFFSRDNFFLLGIY